ACVADADLAEVAGAGIMLDLDSGDLGHSGVNKSHSGRVLGVLLRDRFISLACAAPHAFFVVKILPAGLRRTCCSKRSERFNNRLETADDIAWGEEKRVED